MEDQKDTIMFYNKALTIKDPKLKQEFAITLDEAIEKIEQLVKMNKYYNLVIIDFNFYDELPLSLQKHANNSNIKVNHNHGQILGSWLDKYYPKQAFIFLSAVSMANNEKILYQNSDPAVYDKNEVMPTEFVNNIKTFIEPEG